MALTPEQREAIVGELRAMRDRGASREQLVARERELKASFNTPPPTPESVSGYDIVKQVGKQGLGALESALTVIGAPQAAVVGAIGKYGLGRTDVDPVSNVMTPAFSRQSITGYTREAVDRNFPDLPNWLKATIAFGAGVPADVATDPLTYLTFGASIPSKLAALERAGRGVTYARAAKQAAAGARPAVGLKVPFAMKEPVALVGPQASAAIIEPLEEAGAAITRGALKVPGLAQATRAMADPGIDLRVSRNKGLRQVGAATPDLLSRASRRVAAGDVQEIAKQREILEAVGPQGYADPNVALTASGELDPAALAQAEAALTPAQKSARAATMRELQQNEQELIQRGLLDPQFARGANYVPNVRKTPKPGVDEAVLQGGKLGDDDWIVTTGPTLRAYTPHTREASKTVAEAQAAVEDYVPGLFAPAAVTNAMTRRALATYDSLKDILALRDEAGNAVGKFVPVTKDKVLNKQARDALRAKGYVRLGDTLSGGANPYGNFEQAFHRAKGAAGLADEVWVPKEVDGLLSVTLAKKPLGKFQQAIRKVEGVYVPWLTYLGPDFLGRNQRSAAIYNLMGGDVGSWMATHARPNVYGGAHVAAAKIVANGGNLKKTLQDGFAGQNVKIGKVGGADFTLADAVREMDDLNAITLGGFGGVELSDELAAAIRQATANPSQAKQIFDKAKKVAGFYPRMMRAANATGDTAHRITGYAMHRLRGLTPEQALRDTLKWQVDYSKVLSPEGEMFRTLNPFFRWMQTQFGNAVESLVQRPGKAAALGQYPTRTSQALTDKESRATYQKVQAPFSRDRQEALVGRQGDALTTAFLEPPLTELGVLDPLAKATTRYLATGDAGESMPNIAELARGALRPGPVTSAGLSMLTGMDIGRNRPLESGGEALERLAPAGYIKLVRTLSDMGIPGPIINRMVHRRGGKYYVNAKLLYALEMAPALPTPFVGRDVMRFGTGRPGFEPPEAQWSENPLADLMASDDPQIRAIASNLLNLAAGFKTKTEDTSDLRQIQVLQDKRRMSRERREMRSAPGLRE